MTEFCKIPEFNMHENWQEYLSLHGFCVINLLDSYILNIINEDVNLLLGFIKKCEIEDRFISLGRVQDIAVRNKSSEFLKKIISPYLHQLFDPVKYDFVSGVHLLKSPGDNSALNPHQDSSLVDELNFTSYYVWVPFQDVDENNGTLYVLPRSHKLPIYQRSLTVPWVFEKQEKLLWNFMLPVSVKAGQVIIFHSALIHSSSPNKSDKIRVAANFFIKPKEALYLNYYSDIKSEYKNVEVYNVSPEFYLSCDIMKRPDKKFPLLRTEKNINQLKYKKTLVLDLTSVYKQYINKSIPLLLRFKLWKFSL